MRFGVIVDQGALARAAQKLLDELGIRIDPASPLGRLRIGEQQPSRSPRRFRSAPAY